MTNRQFLGVAAISAVTLTGAADALGPQPTPSVVDYLRAFIHQDFVESHGRLLSAPVVADASVNGLGSLNSPDTHRAELVRAALDADQKRHRLEYVVRTRMSEGVRTSEGLTDRDEIQKQLWTHFVDDKRWLRRVLLALQSADVHSLFGSSLERLLPAEQPLSTDEQSVARIISLLSTYNPTTDSACGQNPYIVFEYAGNNDPLLLADLYTIVGSSPTDGEATRQKAKAGLIQQGWTISKAPENRATK